MSQSNESPAGNTAQLLNGNQLAGELKQSYAIRVTQLIDKGITPCLSVILVGDDVGSQIYVKHKIADCQAVGIRSLPFYFPGNTAPEVVLQKINELNNDASVHGILVQLPLPPQFDSKMIVQAITPNKDVDCFHCNNVGLLTLGQPRFIPCTPHGIMRLLALTGVSLAGKEAVVVGRSNIVGKPMALLLLAADCTVTMCHSRSRDLQSHLQRADIVVAAVGRAQMIRGEQLKPGAIVIDVGMNRLDDKLCGDVDFASAVKVASAITPVPGGVGPMTRAMLLDNCLRAAESSLNSGSNDSNVNNGD